MSKKFLSLVLALAMILSIVPISGAMAYGADAEKAQVDGYTATVSPTDTVAKIGTVSYTSLSAAIQAATNSDIITMVSNTDVTDKIDMSNKGSITLDLNGKTITDSSQIWKTYLFKICTNTSLTIKDSSTYKSGSIESTNLVNHLMYVDGGNLTVNSGKLLNRNTSTNIINVILCACGSVEFNGGSAEMQTTQYNSATIACAKFYSDKKSVITINGGTIKGTSTQSGVETKPFISFKDNNPGYGTMNINGGTFYGKLSTDSGKNVSYTNIKGGTFDHNWAKNGTNADKTEKRIALSEIVADGYEVKDNGNETWTVYKTEVIPTDKQKIQQAQTAINTALASFSVTNDTTKEDIEELIEDALYDAGLSKVSFSVKDFDIDYATTKAKGTLTATVELSLGTATGSVDVEKTIAKITTDEQKANEAERLAKIAINDMKVTNDTSEEILDKLVKETLEKAGLSDVKYTISNFKVESATTEKTGKVTATVKFTIGSEKKTVYLDKTIDKLPPVPEPTKKGWVNTNGKWQYYKDGKALTDWQNNLPGWEGQWFFFDKTTGFAKSAWANDIHGWEGQWFYFNPNTCVMMKNWINDGGTRFFYTDDNTGVMKKGWNLLNWSGGANWFYFDNNGICLTNTTTPDGYYVDANGAWRS